MIPSRLSAPTRPVHDVRSCIVERVWVETPVDTDGDGMADLIAVYIRRPLACDDGLVVPAIYVADPYMLGCDDDGYAPHPTDVELGGAQSAGTGAGDTTAPAGRGAEADSPTCPDPDPDPRARFGAEQPSPAMARGRFRTPRGTGPAHRLAPDEMPELECISDYYAFYNSCGYATVFAGGLGTRGSQGFNDCGSPEETAAFAAVIDWLNGRARAFTNPADGIEVRADWASGKVAMTGKSYLGTMCVALAAAGVDGLETILPVAGISDWYRYYRCNGLACPALGWQGDDIDLLAAFCFSRERDGLDAGARRRYQVHLDAIRAHMDREGGAYNRWWHERNYLAHLPEHPCPAFIMQGLNDMNVKPSQAVRLRDALHGRGTRSCLVLHRGDHCYTHDLEGNPVNGYAHRWLDHYLVDRSTDIADIPSVLIQDDLDPGVWREEPSFPAPDARPLPEFARADRTQRDACGVIADDVDATAFRRDAPEDSIGPWRDELILADPEPRHCLRFDTAPLTATTRFGGTPVVRFAASFDAPAAILSVMLVDIGSHRRLTTAQVSTGSLVCGLDGPTIPTKRFAVERETSAYRILSRGWMDARNAEAPWARRRLEPDAWHRYAIAMEPFDQTVTAGDRLRLIIFGTDPEATTKPRGQRLITIDTASVTLELG